MINIMYTVDPIKRIVGPMSEHAVTEQDHEASSLRFAFPDNIAGTGLESTGTAVRVMYIRPDGGDPVAKTLAFYKHSGGYYLYDWNLQKSDLSKEGRLVFSLCILNIAEGEVEEWHTIPYQIRVLDTIHTDDSDEADETITATVAQRVAVLESVIQGMAGGAPIVVSSTSDMTDTDKIYILSTDSKWYYYNLSSSAWVAGGVYGGVPTDTTLTESGMAADAKTVGDRLSVLDTDVNDLNEQINGTGGGSHEYTIPFEITWEDNEYVTYSTGHLGNREGSSVSNMIPIPANAEKITIKGSALTVSGGYAFYYRNNRSYYVSGATLRDGTNIVTVEIDDIPETATHFSFTTITDNKNLSGASYTYTESDPESQGLAGDVSTLQTELQDTKTGIETIVSGLTDDSGEISWEDGKRLIRIYGVRETSGYRLGTFSASRGDRVIITHDTALPKNVVQIAEVINIANEITYRPLTSEISTSHVDYVVERSMTVAVSVKTANLTAIKWYKMPVLNPALGIEDNQTAIFSYGETIQIVGASRVNPMNKGNKMQKPLVLAHISDIHNSRPNEVSFRQFLDTFGGYLDDAIITGDMAGSKYPDYIPTYAQDGYKNVLLTIGNHDVYDYDGTHGSSDYFDREYFATEKQTYDQYFAPSIPSWNVVQPTNAATNGYCYYYKDYDVNTGDSHTVSTVRLIVLDPMHYNAAQHTWLNDTLLSARTNGYPVVIAEHFIPMETADDMNLFDTSFTSLMPGMRDVYGLYFLSYVEEGIRYKAADLVDDFITNSGEFICWICGHMHFDMVGTLNSHPNQIFIAVGTASAYPNNAYADMPREYGMESENLINIVSFDTYNKMIRVGRIGAKIDDHMRHRGGMCINYASKNIIYSW